jgi:hypothetical protein
MKLAMTLSISDDLIVRLGNAEITLSPRSGLELAEELARKSFRRALDEEAAKAEHEHHSHSRPRMRRRGAGYARA